MMERTQAGLPRAVCTGNVPAATPLARRVYEHLGIGIWSPQTLEHLGQLRETNDTGDQRLGVDPAGRHEIQYQREVLALVSKGKFYTELLAYRDPWQDRVLAAVDAHDDKTPMHWRKIDTFTIHARGADAFEDDIRHDPILGQGRCDWFASRIEYRRRAEIGGPLASCRVEFADRDTASPRET